MEVEKLIEKYLQSKLTLDEQHKLSKWIQSDHKNEMVLKKIRAYWHYHKDHLEKEELDVRLRLLERMRGSEAVKSPNKNSLRFILNIAATTLVVSSLILGLYFYQKKQNLQSLSSKTTLVEKKSQPGQKLTIFLPDSTRVKLNADSKIIVPSKFDSNRREVMLVGEAFFEVTRDEKRPFIIKTAKMEVEVLGTSFNVLAYEDCQSPSVSVKTGMVTVKNRGTDAMIRLNPHEMASINKEILVKSAIDPLSDPFAWTEQKLVFDHESLPEVLRKVSRWYGVDIDINKNITPYKNYTASYHNAVLGEVMDILAFVYDFKYEYDGKRKKVEIY